MTISQARPAEPVLLPTALAVVAALIGASDDRSRQLGRQLAAWREGYERGFTAGVDVGRGAEAHERDEQWNDIARPISRIRPELQERRWMLRGDPRSRDTFGQPHPGDYRGGPVPWERPNAGAA